MSSPLDSVRRVMEATLGRDLVAVFADGLDGDPLAEILREISDPEIEVQMVLPDGGSNASARGIDEYISMWQDWMGPFERFFVEDHEVSVVDGETVLNSVRQSGWLPGSDAPVTQLGWAVWRFAGGRVATIDFYLDRDQARAAAQGDG